MVRSTNGNGASNDVQTPMGQRIPYGVSQIGTHDLVPKLGYREYWYPAAHVRQIGKKSFRLFGRRKPLYVKMLGEDIVLFPGKDGRVAALWDRCPHRGAFLSPGRCEFDGTISCPYHGYTFDENGTCVAALTEGANSPLTGKIRAVSFPTAIIRGVVFVWMGETEPVPIEEDVTEEFLDPDCVMYPYMKRWPFNWSLTVENGGDAHSSYIHRFRVHRIFNLNAFQKIPVAWTGVAIVEETDKSIGHRPSTQGQQQDYFPLLGKKWPQHVWWRFRGMQVRAKRTFTGKPYSTTFRLPSICKTDRRNELHVRYVTPVDENNTMAWTFATRRATKWWHKPIIAFYLRTWYRYFVTEGVNQLEDVPVMSRMDPSAPQKLGMNDRAIIYWRRRMPLKSRDNLRIWKKGVQVADEMEAQEASQQEPEMIRDEIRASADD